MINDYYPDPNDDRADWWQNIADNAPAILTTMSFPTTFIDAILADAAMAIYGYRTLRVEIDRGLVPIYGWITTILEGSQGLPFPAAPAMPTLPTPPAAVLTGVEKRRPGWVQTIKGSTKYNPATFGVQLRLEPTGAPFDPATYQAEIRQAVALGGGDVHLRLAKARGNIDANRVRGRRSGTAPWTVDKIFTAAEATLAIPGLAPDALEEWELEARGVKADVEIGLPSDLERVVVRG